MTQTDTLDLSEARFSVFLQEARQAALCFLV
jgi:hypothetical protein